MFIDTHAHLYLKQFEKDIDEVILKSKNRNVQKIFLPNIDQSTTEAMFLLRNKYPETCFPMIGLHPCSVKKNFQNELLHIEEILLEEKVYGIGETGIDLYWDKSFKKAQIYCFEYQIELALKSQLPIIIHSRDSLDITIKLIENQQTGELKGIFHCFNGTIEQSEKIEKLNFLMGIGGVITYKNAGLSDMIRKISLHNIVLETDSPYLSPVPYRGKRNESPFIPIIAEKIAEIKNIDIDIIEKQTTRNALELFGIEY